MNWQKEHDLTQLQSATDDLKDAIVPSALKINLTNAEIFNRVATLGDTVRDLTPLLNRTTERANRHRAMIGQVRRAILV